VTPHDRSSVEIRHLGVVLKLFYCHGHRAYRFQPTDPEHQQKKPIADVAPPKIKLAPYRRNPRRNKSHACCLEQNDEPAAQHRTANQQAEAEARAFF
jgi:hypothetical protein